MQLLPKWVLPPSLSSVYDSESFTSLEMVVKVYGAMNALIEEYNKFADTANKRISDHTTEETNARSDFEQKITKVTNQFMCSIERYLKLEFTDTATKAIHEGIADGSIAYPVDTTLSATGVPAEAAAVGAKIAEVIAMIESGQGSDQLLEQIEAELEAMETAIEDEAAARTKQINETAEEMRGLVENEAAARTAAITAEAAARTAAITAEAAARQEQIDTETAALNAAIADEAAARENQVSAESASIRSALDVERKRIDAFTTLPAGSTAGDAELIDTRNGFGSRTFTNTGEAVRTQTEENFRLINESNKFDNDYAQHTSGHFWKIEPDKQHAFKTYRTVNGAISEHIEVVGSDYIKCPKELYIHFGDASTRVYIYFYSVGSNGEFTVTHDVFNTVTSAGVHNYINQDVSGATAISIPEGVYMRISVAVGSADFYGWDGKPFGVRLCEDVSFTAVAGSMAALNPEGSGNVTIPGDALFLLGASGASFMPVHGVKNGVREILLSKNRRFLPLPRGYDFFTARIYNDEMTTRTGDVSRSFAVVIRNVESEKPSGAARNVLANCEIVNGLEWTPAADRLINTEVTRKFRAGVKYNGIPYASQWTNAHFVGWHVTPHTFANAVNDSESIFYKENSYLGDRGDPYYGIVCSSYATMCAGFPYPNTNAGLLQDPEVIRSYTATPPLGSIYGDLTGHCMIPERVDHFEDNSAISVYESVTPISTKALRISNVKKADVDSYTTGHGAEYFKKYGIAIRHKAATGDLSNVPYAHFSNVVVRNGTARPYKGDQSVYTTAEEKVLINIKDPAAKSLYVAKGGGAQRTITISGQTQIDVKAMLDGSGIYSVWTDVGSVKESFEYVEAGEIYWKIENGVVQFSSDDFWYATIVIKGEKLFDGLTKECCVPAHADGDYSPWCRDGHYMTRVSAVFRKAQYGAYVVPIVQEV